MKKSAQSDLQFRGFISPRYTQVPDELFDDLMAHLSGAELKVLLYIIRRTFGFKKDVDNISLKQICKGITTRDGEELDRGTGLSLSTVQLAIKGLIEKNCVVTIRNRSDAKGDEATTYSLNTLPYTENRQGGIPKIGNGGYRKSVTQETVLQETDIQNRISSSKLSSNDSNPNKKDHKTQTIGDILKRKLTTKTPVTQNVPDSLKAAVQITSEELGDSRRNLQSNLTRVLNLADKAGKNLQTFEQYIYQAKSITKQQANVKKKMPYFFSVLEEEVGLKTLVH